MGSFIGNILTARELLCIADSQVIASREDKFLDGDFETDMLLRTKTSLDWKESAGHRSATRKPWNRVTGRFWT
jgi:hypothetical protein